MACECVVQREAREGQPGRSIELVEVPDLGADEPGKPVQATGNSGAPPIEISHSPRSQGGEPCGEEEVHRYRCVHGEGGGKHKEQDVQGIEDCTLEVGEEGNSEVDPRVPEGDSTIAQCLGGECPVRVHVGHRVVPDHDEAGEDELPGEEERGGEDGQRKRHWCDVSAHVRHQ